MLNCNKTVKIKYSFSSFWQVLHDMRPCLNKLETEYCVKIKVIALDWQWVTLRSRCQMNCNSHSYTVKNKVENKPHQSLEKLKITSGKSTIFGHFLVKYFYTSGMPDLVFALLLDTCWVCFGFGSCEWKRKEKTRVSGWFQGKLNFFENQIFNKYTHSGIQIWQKIDKFGAKK